MRLWGRRQRPAGDGASSGAAAPVLVEMLGQPGLRELRGAEGCAA